MAVTCTSHFVRLLERELHYVRWRGGEADKGGAGAPRRLVIMWHGLTRTGRDFDELAAAVVRSAADAGVGCDVVCPDTIGRGFSQWSPQPETEYTVPFYVRLAEALLAHLGFAECDWVGTSMGGLIGFTGAATLLKGKIRRLVLNDVGTELNVDGLRRIFKYSSTPQAFDRFTDFEKYYHENIFHEFGPVSDTYKRRTLEAYVRRDGAQGGKFTTHYDPIIISIIEKALLPPQETVGAEGSAPAPAKADPWALWAAVDAPVLIIRGALSDLLLPACVAKMVATHSTNACQSVEVAGCGHAPSLSHPDQTELVTNFLKF